MRKPIAVLAPILLLTLAGCSDGQLLLDGRSHPAGYDELLEQAPPPPGQNIHVIELDRSESQSVHLVRIRDREQPHLHTRYDVFVVLLRGKGSLWLGGERRPMREGDTAFIRRGRPHHFVNEGSSPAAAMAVFAPAFDGPDQQPVAAAETGSSPR